MDAFAHPMVDAALALVVGVVLGLLGGGGSILALPIFLHVFGIPVKSAVPMSLVVVGMSALVGFAGHWRQGTVSLRIAGLFGGCAMLGSFGAARLAHRVPGEVQLGLFSAFAMAAAVMMLRDARRPPAAAGAVPEATGADGGGAAPRPGLAFVLQAVGVGALTALIGAGGGFLIVPTLVLLARVPTRQAIGSSLLIIAMNAASGVAGYAGTVPIAWGIVGPFTAVASVGALAGTRLSRHVPQRRLKQAFAAMILVLGAYFLLRRLHVLP